MSDLDKMVDQIMKQISGSTVNAIFGESRQIGDTMVIPVGKIAYGWGGGGGKAEKEGKEEKKEEENEGMGIGMGVKVIPVGFVTVTKDNATFQPIVEMGPIVAICTIFSGLILLKFCKHMMWSKMMSKKHGCRKK